MDNILIIIAVVAFFIFTTYSNYKKEQEKAKTRNPSIPHKQPTSTPSSKSEVPAPIEIPKWLEEFLPPQPEAKPLPQPIPVSSTEQRGSIDYKPVKYQQVKYVPSELPADLLKEYRNLPEKKEMEELKRSAAIHKSNLHQTNRLNSVVLIEEDQQQENTEVLEFDLRKAIIMNAILERPFR
jgi:hypothetical protein